MVKAGEQSSRAGASSRKLQVEPAMSDTNLPEEEDVPRRMPNTKPRKPIKGPKVVMPKIVEGDAPQN